MDNPNQVWLNLVDNESRRKQSDDNRSYHPLGQVS
jgi:hypothetical protein